MLYRIKADIQETNPKVVIMWGFINDIFRSAPDNLNEKINNIKQNIISIVEICKVEGVTPLLATEVTITTRNTWKEKVMTVIGKLRGKESYSDYINKHVIETNNWLRSYANKNNIIILDFEKVLSDENGERKREYATEDGSHLSKRAYEALNEYMRVFDSMQHSK
jgi:lysophospholipase L1-like esterase